MAFTGIAGGTETATDRLAVGSEGWSGAYQGPLNRTPKEAVAQIAGDMEAWLEDGDEREIVFRVTRKAMTDEQYDALPEWEGP